MSPDLRTHLEASLGGSYTIERELGGGGMSRVFVAVDRALGRRVVIKVLSPELAAEVSSKRFEREIRLAASLQQANIVPVLSAGVTDGVPHYTMPFVEGLSLRERLKSGGPPPLSQTIGILRDVARALAYAHDRGVVHRDIKPENVLLSGDAAVVTDFGIAKAIASARVTSQSSEPTAHSSVTQVGTAVGTPAYMAPEQISGDPSVDHRADLYSFGCLAYELFSGRPPFESQTVHGLFAAHLSERPKPVHEKHADIPPALAAAIMQCLEKDPAARPQSARDVLHALDATTTPASGVARLLHRFTRPQRRAIVALGSVVAVAAIVAFWPASLLSDRPSALAIVPFLNLGGDTAQEYLADGMADGLATALGKVDGIKVVSRSLGYRYKGQRAIDARAVGQALSVDHVLHGAVRRVGDRIRVSAQLTSARDNAEVWSDSYDRSATDLYAVQDEITRRIASALGGRLGNTARDATSTTIAGSTNPEAHDLYLRGRFLLQRRGAGVRQAAEKFEQAIAKDSNFALAHASLALALELLPYFESVNARELAPRATRAAERALSLDSTIAEAHTALAMAHQHRYDWRRAEASYRRAIALDPDEVDAHIQYGRFLVYTGQVARSEAVFRRARELDPNSAVASGWLGSVMFRRGRRNEGLAEMRRAVELDSTNPPSLTFLARALRMAGRPEEARLVAERIWRNVPAWRHVAANIFITLGDTVRGAAVWRTLEAQRATHPHANLYLIMKYSAMGDSTRMFQALEHATANGEIWPTYYPADSENFDFARGSARFAAIIRSVGLDARVFATSTYGRSP